MAAKKTATAPKGWKQYTQQMATDDAAHSGEDPIYNVGQYIYDPQFSRVGGQAYITLKDGRRVPYNEHAAGDGQADFLKGMMMIGGGALAGGAFAGAGGMGTGFDPGMFSAADWAGTPVWGGAGDVAGGVTGGGGSTFGGNGGGMWDDFFNFDPNIGDYNPGALDTPNLNDPFQVPNQGAPYQPGYNMWDPSTYGGSPGSGFPNVPNMPRGGMPGSGSGGMPGTGGNGYGPGGGSGNFADMLGMIMGLNSLFGGGNDIDPAKMQQLWDAGMKTYNTGLDPQNKMRNRTQGRIVDATRAGQSARGIAMSPYAAAGEGEAVKNFNIDWQNQQLARQKTGFDALALGSGGYFNQANTDRTFNAGQTAAGTNALLTGASNLMGPGGWLNSLFGGGAGGGDWSGDTATMSGGSASPSGFDMTHLMAPDAAGDAFGPSGGAPHYLPGGNFNTAAYGTPSDWGGGNWQQPYQQSYNAYNGGP